MEDILSLLRSLLEQRETVAQSLRRLMGGPRTVARTELHRLNEEIKAVRRQAEELGKEANEAAHRIHRDFITSRRGDN